MCGIGGIWRRGGGRAEHGELRRMMSALSHRGPEGAAFGRMDRGALILGFLRLGFTGMGLCQQPLYNEDDSIGLVYNGEIYDHMALRADLSGRGHVFRTTSDSEVIIHLYEEHGDRFLGHAFALIGEHHGVQGLSRIPRLVELLRVHDAIRACQPWP